MLYFTVLVENHPVLAPNAGYLIIRFHYVLIYFINYKQYLTTIAVFSNDISLVYILLTDKQEST